MKVAIIHDELMRKGGAEQVVLTMLKAFPNADIYTLAYDPEGTYPEYRNYKINTSKFQFFAKNVKVMHALFFPFGIIAMQSMKIKDYDVVLISNTHCAKYVQIDPKSLVIMYTHTPFRLAWNPTSYTQYLNSKGAYRWVFNRVINALRKIDSKSAQRGDYFIANTVQTAQRIRDSYKATNVSIINPDVKVRNFHVNDKIGDYYLVVSRLEFYKKVDLAIQAFNKLNYKLIIVGNGTKIDELKDMANDNITFKSGVDNTELAELYANCKALIFPQHEDYGITPLEANASGRPVIAYGKGGVLETMIPYDGKSSDCTAVFFDEQSVESLIEAVKISEIINFNPAFIRENALRFDEKVFIEKLVHFVDEKYHLHINKTGKKLAI
ncbi:glycosyltransferase [Mucilaginibacter terrae]|uniref:Glycosyltransferase involved in cell wall biosynthesis n=1 Tax=Mucilaginibacter terrae TaxID=1955052 RepID=A0ABU3GPP8_9SPHI|nr:glycosyltransferase [Mucilaginibacter terrae]MDT3401760.1 glycosyltransferase involved in cell wall biosynthesis [Mucilaginibacter terrae]